jgi:cell shape-determining protein MreD
MLTIIFIEFRYYGLLPSLAVFASGLASDLFTGSPPGFWSLLFLLALAMSRTINALAGEKRTALAIYGFIISALVMTAAIWLLTSLYHMQWQEGWKFVRAGVAAALLWPLPALALIGLEEILITGPAKEERNGPFSPAARRRRTAK